MAPRLGYVVAAAGLLALCCVVTMHSNDESIRAETEHSVSGMMFEHGESRESDDLSESDRELIAAAGDNDDDERPTIKYSELTNVQNKGDRARKGEDKEDELSPDDANLINAAGKLKSDDMPLQKYAVAKKKVAAKAEPKAVEDLATEFKSEKPRKIAYKKRSADKDGLSAEERALISAANNNEGKVPTKMAKTATKKAHMPHLHATRMTTLKAQVMASIKHKLAKKKAPADFKKKPWGEMNDGERKLRSTDDALSPEMRELIAAASHEDPHNLQRAKMQLGPNLAAIAEHLDSRTVEIQTAPKQVAAVDQKAIMKKAMEKITKAAAQQAVMAATTTMPELHAAAVARQPAPVAPVPSAVQPSALSMHDARSIVYGMSSHPMHGPVHFDEDEHDDKEEPTQTLKSVEQARSDAKTMLKVKFQKLEAQSSKTAEDSWQRQLEAADQHAAKMAMHQALPLSHIEIARARLMRRNLAAQYRANNAFQGSSDLDAVIEGH